MLDTVMLAFAHETLQAAVNWLKPSVSSCRLACLPCLQILEDEQTQVEQDSHKCTVCIVQSILQ